MYTYILDIFGVVSWLSQKIMKRILFEGACLAIVQIVAAANSQEQAPDSIYAPMHLSRHQRHDLKEGLYEGASDDEMRAYRDSYALHYAMPRKHYRHSTHHRGDIAGE